MTDGAAFAMRELGIKNKGFDHLVSNTDFWTSGQWMTEKKGGSDVGGATDTVWRKGKDGYALYGYKWFTSAIDSEVSLTLAREVSSEGVKVKGSKGLSLFYLETRNEDKSLNGLSIVRLKDKLGTRQLPTPELILKNTKA